MSLASFGFRAAAARGPSDETIQFDYANWRGPKLEKQASLRRINQGTGSNRLKNAELLAKVKAYDAAQKKIAAENALTARTSAEDLPAQAEVAIPTPPAAVEPPAFEGYEVVAEYESDPDDDSLVGLSVLALVAVVVVILSGSAVAFEPIVVDDEPAPESEENTKFRTFGSGKILRSTVDRWLAEYPWLDVSDAGAQCKVCSQKFPRTRAVLINMPYADQTHLRNRMKKHETSAEHVSVSDIMTNLRSGVSKMRAQLRKIVKTIFKIARLEIPHTVHVHDLLSFFSCLHQDRDFCAWLKQDVTYTSSTVVRELLELIGLVLEKRLYTEIRESRFWSATADATTDVTGKHQLVATVRYLRRNAVQERFIGLEVLHDQTATGYATKIKQMLCYLPKGSFVSCSFDGASAMSGKFQGAEKKVRGGINATALFMWCCAHVLNLLAQDGIKAVAFMGDFFRTVRALWLIFSDSDINKLLLSSVFADPTFAAMCEKVNRALVEPSDTRWLAYWRSVSVIRMQYSAIREALRRIWNERNSTHAEHLYKEVSKPQFFACLALACDVLEKLHAISLVFQGTATTISDVCREVDSLEAELRALSSEERAKKITKYYTCWRRSFFEATNVAVTPAAFSTFHQTIASPYIAALLKSTTVRFESKEVLRHFVVFDRIAWPEGAHLTNWGDEHIRELYRYYSKPGRVTYRQYEVDVPATDTMPRPTYSTTRSETKTDHGTPLLHGMTEADLVRDWTLLKEVLRASRYSKNAHAVYQAFAPDGTASARMQPLRQLVELAQTIVSSSAESERQFSTLARVKTRLRNRMLNTTLRALFFIEDTDEKEMDDATAEEVIDLFTSGFAAEALRAAWFAGESEPVEKVAKKRKIDLTLP